MGSACLACGCTSLVEILDFGPQPAANLLSEELGAPVRAESLGLAFCDACGHAQQIYFYPPEELFSEYLYASGTSETLARYFGALASALVEGMSPGQTLLDIASNDGSFLTCFQGSSVKAYGIEPAGKLVESSRKLGIETTHGFWPETSLGHPVDRIVAMNVLAHGPDPLAFLTAVKENLTEHGLAFIQVSQVDMFENFEFDTLYHEHYSFFCPNSLKSLAERAGFRAWRFCKMAIHGGSLMAILGMDDEAVNQGSAGLVKNPEICLGEVSSDLRPSLATAKRFSAEALMTCETLRQADHLARLAGYRTVVVGAAAKAITVLQVSGLRPHMVVDEAPLKIGRYLPGQDNKIFALAEVGTIKEPCLFVIGAWNFKSELIRKIAAIRKRNDAVLVYFPKISIESLPPDAGEAYPPLS